MNYYYYQYDVLFPVIILCYVTLSRYFVSNFVIIAASSDKRLWSEVHRALFIALLTTCRTQYSLLQYYW